MYLSCTALYPTAYANATAGGSLIPKIHDPVIPTRSLASPSLTPNPLLITHDRQLTRTSISRLLSNIRQLPIRLPSALPPWRRPHERRLPQNQRLQILIRN